MKLTFVFVILGVLYFLSWIVQLVSGGQETAAQRRARMQARSEALRKQLQQSQQRPQGQRPRPQARPEPREVSALRSLERTLGLPAGSIAPVEPTPAPRPAPPPAPRPVAPLELEDHGGDLSDHHLRVGRRDLPHLQREARRDTVGDLRGHHLDSSFREERAWELVEQQRALGLRQRLAHLTPLQEAMVLSEVFQPPLARRRRRR